MSKERDSKTEESIVSFKGFDKDFSCRGYKFEIGGTYEHDGEVKACEGGFHACEHPLNVFSYYPPATSRYARVIQSGQLSRHEGDTKIASSRITIEAELKGPELVAAAVKWVFDRANWKDGPVATGNNEGCTASGDQGAATASGDQGAATASGCAGRVSGKEGNALFLVYRPSWDGPIDKVWAGIVGQNGIKADTFYRLSAAGQPVECEIA